MRYVLAISAIFLTGALSAFAAVDPALLALVPPGTKLVSGVQLDQARSSDFGQYLLNRIHTRPLFELRPRLIAWLDALQSRLGDADQSKLLGDIEQHLHILIILTIICHTRSPM